MLRLARQQKHLLEHLRLSRGLLSQDRAQKLEPLLLPPEEPQTCLPS